MTRLIAAVLPVGDGAIATESQLDALLESVVARVVAGSGQLRTDPPTKLDELVDAMVLPLARDSVAQARAGLVARVPLADLERVVAHALHGHRGGGGISASSMSASDRFADP